MSCPICFNDMDEMITPEHINPTITTTINHSICLDCYKALRSNSCPYCRCEIKTYPREKEENPKILDRDAIRDYSLFYRTLFNRQPTLYRRSMMADFSRTRNIMEDFNFTEDY